VSSTLEALLDLWERLQINKQTTVNYPDLVPREEAIKATMEEEEDDRANMEGGKMETLALLAIFLAVLAALYLFPQRPYFE